VQFFIPDFRDDPAVAEAEWQRYLSESPAPPESRRVFSITYEHDGDIYEVSVGQARKRYRRQTGPRRGYIKNAGTEPWGRESGTMVSGIIDAGDVLYVWSYGPPFDGWANPSFVGRREVRRIEYFTDSRGKAEVPGDSGHHG
jgi:hypothetical protein